MGGVGNGVTEEIPGWDLNKKAGHHVGQGQYRTMGDNGGQCGTWPDHAGEKEVKGLLLVGHEEVPHGSGLRTGGCDDTADAAEDRGSPAQLSTGYREEPGEVRCGLSFFFFWQMVLLTGMF